MIPDDAANKSAITGDRSAVIGDKSAIIGGG